MALQRMKWSATGADLIRTQARDGAMVRGLDDPPVVHRRGAVHVHVHGYRTADQATPARSPATPPGDQPSGGLPAEADFRDRGVVPRGRDQEGRNWSARIYGLGGAGYSEEDPARYSPRRVTRTPEVPASSKPARRSRNAWRAQPLAELTVITARASIAVSLRRNAD
jgi:hypothetical protein